MPCGGGGKKRKASSTLFPLHCRRLEKASFTPKCGAVPTSITKNEIYKLIGRSLLITSGKVHTSSKTQWLKRTTFIFL